MKNNVGGEKFVGARVPDQFSEYYIEQKTREEV